MPTPHTTREPATSHEEKVTAFRERFYPAPKARRHARQERFVELLGALAAVGLSLLPNFRFVGREELDCLGPMTVSRNAWVISDFITMATGYRGRRLSMLT